MGKRRALEGMLERKSAMVGLRESRSMLETTKGTRQAWNIPASRRVEMGLT